MVHEKNLDKCTQMVHEESFVFKSPETSPKSLFALFVIMGFKQQYMYFGIF